MESFFYQGQPEECIVSLIDETWASLSTKQSDFVPYVEQKWLNVDRTRSKNVKVRMVEMLREKWKKTVEAMVLQKEKSFRYMVRERMRRQIHREGYMGLRSILPHGTKCDKISVTTAAISEIIKTRRMLDELERINRELNEKVEAAKGKVRLVQRISKVRISVGDPTSSMDSMAEVLHCLKDLGSDIKKLQSHFSDQEFSAELEISSQISGAEVEKAVQKTLLEVEKKLLRKRRSIP